MTTLWRHALTTVAACQLPSHLDDPDLTWAEIEFAVACAGETAQLVVLPELCLTGSSFRTAAEAQHRAEAVDGPTLTRLAALSARHRCVLVAGWIEDSGKALPYNSAVVIDHGQILGNYRKTHLWGDENLHFIPGERPAPVLETCVGRVGLLICYDLEIPEVVRAIARAGAQLLAVPANWPKLARPTGQPPIEIAKAQAAASTNKVHVVVADRCGTDRAVAWTGGSIIVDCSGYLKGSAALGEPAVVTGLLDPAAADDKQLGPFNDAFGDLRPQLYGSSRLVRRPTGMDCFGNG